MTAFDRAWTFLKYDTGDGYSPDVPPWEKANYNPPIPEGAVEGPDGLEWKRGLDPNDSRLKDSHNSYIPLDEKGEPLSMEPMSWGSAKSVLDSYEEETGIPYDALNQIVPFEGGLADMILDSGEME